MGRVARIVVPGVPHHVTQRGRRRQQVFFSEADYRAYRALLAEWTAEAGLAVWAYCLMPNHVHLVVVPGEAGSLDRAMRQIHRRYALRVNRAQDWTGHLWQGRYGSFPMDDAHLHGAVRYVELNPVRAGLAADAVDWLWSSARHHLGLRHDPMIADHPLRQAITDWRAYLAGPADGPAFDALRVRERTGRPLGDDAFLRRLEGLTGRRLRRRKPGRPASGK